MEKLSLILCAMPGQTRSAQVYNLPIGHMAWQIGPALRLVSQSVGASMQGGYMMLGDAYYDGSTGDASQTVSELTRVCAQHSFSGIIFDFEQYANKNLEVLLTEAVPILRRRSFDVIVPERFSAICPDARLLVSTAVQAGSLQAFLRDTAERYGNPRRVVLDFELLRRDILLPSPQSVGKVMSKEELAALLETKGKQTFYSQELFARYFTYRETGEDGASHHFIIYDDAYSFTQKILLAQRLGFANGLIQYPEVESDLREILSGLGI